MKILNNEYFVVEDKLNKEIEKEIIKVEEKQKYFIIPQSKAIDAITGISGNKIKVIKDIVTNKVSFTTEEGVEFLLDKFEKTFFNLPISAHKILITAIKELISINDTNIIYNEDAKINYEVKIPLSKYAKDCGKDIEEHQTNSEKEAIKEINRVKAVIKRFKKQLADDLNTLKKLSNINWTEKVKGKNTDYIGRTFIIGYDVIGGKNGIIKIQFHPQIIRYLLKIPKIQYNKKLLKIDNKSDNAYKIGNKLSANYFRDCNRTMKENPNKYRILKVKTLLKASNLPTEIDVKESKSRSWRYRIKEPFEKILDELYQKEIIEDWKYCGAKGIDLADEEAKFKNFTEWSNTNIFYDMKDKLSDTERIENNNNKHKKRAENKKKFKTMIKKEKAKLIAKKEIEEENKNL